MTTTPTLVEALDDPWPWLPPLPAALPDLVPLSGMVALDPIAAALFGEPDVDFDDPAPRRRFTATLIGAATPMTVTTYLSVSQLRDDWRRLDLPSQIRTRWEQTFPELIAPRR